MPNQNPVPHNHVSSGAAGSHTPGRSLSEDINKTLNDIVAEQVPVTKAPSILSDTDETFVVANSGGGTIITDTKGTGWSFSDAVKRSVNRWVRTKQTEIKDVVADKTIATEKIQTADTRVETIRKAAGNIAPGDGVQSLKKAPVVVARVHRTKPVSSIRVKPKDIPKEIGETKPRWKYIVESDEPMSATPAKATTTAPSASVPLLRDAPTPLLLPAHKTAPVVVAREYRKPSGAQKVATQAPTTPSMPRVSPQVMTSTPAPLTPAPEQTPMPIATPVAPTVAAEVRASVAPRRDELQPLVDALTRRPSAAARARGLPVPTLLLVIIFVAVIVVGNGVRTWLTAETTSSTEVAPAVSGLGIPVTTLVNISPTEFASTIREAVGTQSFALNYGGTSNVEVTIFSPTFVGASRYEVGVYNDEPFFMIDFNNRDTGLGIMLQLEPNLGAVLETLFGLRKPYQFSDRVSGTNDLRTTTDILGNSLVYTVLPSGVILIANTETTLRELITIFE